MCWLRDGTQSMSRLRIDFVVGLAMENRKKKKSGISAPSRILGDKTFAAITAVEGLRLNAASRKRMSAMKVRKLTPAQKRAEVLRAYSHDKGR